MLEDKLSKKYAKAFLAVFHEKLSLEVTERIESVTEFLRRQRAALFYVQLSAFDNEATKKSCSNCSRHLDYRNSLQAL